MGIIYVSVITEKKHLDVINSYFITKCLNSAVITNHKRASQNTYLEHNFNNIQIPKGFIQIYSCFPDDKKLKQKIKKFITQLNINTQISFNKIPEGNNSWVDFFPGIIIQDKLNILPPWLINDKNLKYAIQINPGANYGSGNHPTSRLCLEYLTGIDLKGKNVADIGSGSGILGICSLKLGAACALMLEYDKKTVKNCKSNVRLNNFHNKVKIRKFDVEKKPVRNINKYDIIICNIWPHVNEKFALLNRKKIKKSAQILFTGVYQKDHNVFKDFLEKNSFHIYDVKTMQNWNLYITVKKSCIGEKND